MVGSVPDRAQEIGLDPRAGKEGGVDRRLVEARHRPAIEPERARRQNEIAALKRGIAERRRLAQLGIPAKVNLRSGGTHSWGYWQDDLHDSWPMLAEAVGA